MDILKAFSRQLGNFPHGVPQMLCALAFSLQAPAQAVIAGNPEAQDFRRLSAKMRSEFSPFRVLLAADGKEAQAYLSKHSEAIAEMVPVKGKSALYICENFTCQAAQTI